MEKTLNKTIINYLEYPDIRRNSAIELYCTLLELYSNAKNQIVDSSFFSLEVNNQFILFSRDIFTTPDIQKKIHSFLTAGAKNEYYVKLQNAPGSCFNITYDNKTKTANLKYLGQSYNFRNTTSKISAQIMSFLIQITLSDILEQEFLKTTSIGTKRLISHNLALISPFAHKRKNRFELRLLDTKMDFNHIAFMQTIQCLTLISLFETASRPIQVISYIENGVLCIEFNIPTKKKYAEINLPIYFRKLLKSNNYNLCAWSSSSELTLKLITPYENTHS